MLSPAVLSRPESNTTGISRGRGGRCAVRVRREGGGGLQGQRGEALEPAEIRASESKSEFEPVESGTAQVGETLTADTSGIADADGLANVSHSYQRQADGADISRATGSSYTLADTDEGKAVTVTVSFTYDAGGLECAGVPGRG